MATIQQKLLKRALKPFFGKFDEGIQMKPF